MNNSVLTTQGRKNIPRVKLGTRHQITIPCPNHQAPRTQGGRGIGIGGERESHRAGPSQAYSQRSALDYTDEWRRMMQEAFEDLREGRMLGPFESVEVFKQAIEARAHRS